MTVTVMENIWEVQRRADSDSLRYIGLVAAFLVIRGAGASSLSILGLQIHDTKLIQFALVLAAAFFVIRYAKAQVLTESFAQFLRRQLEKLPDVSPMIGPPDWDIIRDITHRGHRGHRVRRLLSGGLGAFDVHAGRRRSGYQLARFHRQEQNLVIAGDRSYHATPRDNSSCNA